MTRMSIAQRIYLGFAVIVAVAIALAAMGIGSAGQARDNARRFRELNERTFAILELGTEVAELQRSVQLFASTGHESLATDAKQRITSLRERFDTSDAIEAGEDSINLVERMRTSLKNYEGSLETAVDERRVRYELVRTELPKLDARLEAFAEGQTSVTDDSRWGQIRTSSRLVRSNLYQYLYEPDYALLTDSVELTRQMGALAETDQERAFVRLLEDYSRTFTRIVQATRGYLYLVGVVMAGEAWEFTHLSERLRSVALADVPQIVDGMETLADSVRRRTLVGAGLAIAAAFVLSWLVARSISQPLTDVTRTLDRLAKGEHVAQVPGVDRGDEVGVMAAAADAFRRANERTESLLEKSRELGLEVQASRKDLERSNQELEQFVYTVSHDLKTPLVTSLGFIGMMREMAAGGQLERAMSKLDVLERSNRRMSRLIAELLDLSRVGRLDTEREDIDAAAAVESTVEDLSSRLDQAGCQVLVEGELPRVRMNPTRFRQVVENLLTNAIKYGRPEEGPFEVRIAARKAAPGRVALCIADRGPGIPPAHHKRVFGLFNRLTVEGEGTGLGLAIVQRVMETSGGTVELESSGDGNGCTFVLEFEASG
ncbi:MAG: sensor histidine kinase [Nannocystales bacterium]